MMGRDVNEEDDRENRGLRGVSGKKYDDPEPCQGP